MTNYIVLELLEDGPILVKGAVSFISKTGAEPKDSTRIMTLCRCGCSRNKPLCVMSHVDTDIKMPAAEIE